MPSVLNIFFTLLSISHVTYGTKVENIGIRPSGHLLLNTFDQGKMYTIDPSTKNPNIEPDLFASLRATSLDSELITYTTTIDIPSLGVYGTVTLHSVAPPQYPCGLNVAGVSEEMLPNVGWANAVPDAYASVDLVINGTKLQFSDGIGYHDKNWGTAPLADNLETWYWGHARVGPYSIVWFDATPPNGAERFSAYVAKNGIVAQASCANKSVFVRPWGANSTYPPLPSTGPMQGIEVTFELGNGETLAANVTTGAFVASDGDYYVRTLGSLSATIKSPGRDDEVFHGGRALYEEFKFGPSQK
ncbi:hypothetical protein M431DRAFT_4303 [Trichoderma harzianum CBS 226.95]|uniref:Hydroxyneurosporene synthase n=1 Tax=Trichoderma harzianum CBS 226.95 TaxID=983964 RepID=A0A2T4AJK0_TRIHA|nr:hypothetical protein M431DRAFT_4303 [Trichoderma harzianum CBS 226.95]PTB57241.1 hypothetical protein M431DRAFT_4303 [Trichoderma harzianum CBS 226.95]